MLSGLPPLVREGDRFGAMLTLRNTTAREMKVRATLQGTANTRRGHRHRRTPLALPAQDVALAAGAAQEVVWPVDVPAEAFSIVWEAGGRRAGGGARRTALKVDAARRRRRCRCACCRRRCSSSTARSLPLPRRRRAGRRAARGAASSAAASRSRVQPQLSGALPGMRRYFETYPFVCLEQKTSKAVGLRDAKLWARGRQHAADLPRQRRPGELLPAARRRRRRAAATASPPTCSRPTHEAGFALPAAARDAMLAGLAALRRRPHRAQVLVAARPTSTCASSPRSKRCRATAARSRRCSARSTSRRTSGRPRR